MQGRKVKQEIEPSIIMSINGVQASLKGGLTSDIVEQLKKSDFSVLHIGPGEWFNIEELLMFVGRVRGLVLGSDAVDWGVVNQFVNVEVMDVGGWFVSGLNFKKFNKLRRLKTYWNKGYGDDVYRLPNLEALSIRGWDQESCEKLGSLENLSYLELLECRKLVSLSGLDGVTKLQGLVLYSVPKLEDISAIGELGELRFLEIESCKRIKGYGVIGRLGELLELRVVKSADIESLSFLENLHHLKKIQFGYGLKVKDCDLLPLYSPKDLKVVRFSASKGYNVRQKDVEEYLLEKWGEYDKYKGYWRIPSFKWKEKSDGGI